MLIHMLTTQERDILHFEDTHPTMYARKEEDIRRTFGIHPARYYQQLEQLIDNPDAEVVRPMLVHRLRRMRDERVRARIERRKMRQGDVRR